MKVISKINSMTKQHKCTKTEVTYFDNKMS